MSDLIKKHKIEFSLVIISIILLIFYVFRFVTIFDEDYSLLLSNHSFSNIIKLDSIDVHPPLYYFLLKIFIILTTFWTDSLLIKILSARILSVIISLISFIFLIKICKELNIKNNIFVQWISYLLVPGVISFTYEFIKIRMYALGALFIILQLYALIKYDKNNKNKYIIVSTIMTTLCLYTNYYTALISGILLLIYVVKDICLKRSGIQLFISGVLSLVLFIPWMPILLKQLSLQSNHPIGGLSSQWLITLFIIIIFFYPLIWLYHQPKCSYLFQTYLCLALASLLLFIIMSTMSILFKPVFTFRYFYPILLIYCFLGLNIYFKMLKKKNGKRTKIISILILIINILLCTGGYVDQIYYYGLSSYQIVNNFLKWNHTSKKIISLPSINNSDKGFDIEKSIYLSGLHKKIIVPNTKKNKPTDISMTYKNPSYTQLFKCMNSHIINK